MNNKDTKEVAKSITLAHVVRVVEQQNPLILYVGELQELGNYHIPTEYFKFIYLHKN